MMKKIALAGVAAVFVYYLASPASADCLESGAAECGNYGSGGYTGYAPSGPQYEPYGFFGYHGVHIPYDR